MAPIWLLRGNAGAWIVRNCDGRAAERFCSVTNRSFAAKGASFAAICWVDKGYIQVHHSLKSDRFVAKLKTPLGEDQMSTQEPLIGFESATHGLDTASTW